MKRIAIICVVLLLFTVGCNKKEDTKPILNNIEFDVDITYYNEKYSAKGSIDAKNKLILKFEEPLEIDGMEFMIDGDDTEINYKGLTYKPSKDTLLSSAVGLLYRAMNAFNTEKADFEYSSKNYSVSANVDEREVFMNFSPSGLPLDIECQSAGFYAEFSDLAVLKNE